MRCWPIKLNHSLSLINPLIKSIKRKEDNSIEFKRLLVFSLLKKVKEQGAWSGKEFFEFIGVELARGRGALAPITHSKSISLNRRKNSIKLIKINSISFSAWLVQFDCLLWKRMLMDKRNHK